jgi:uncharacterized protein YkwD
VPVLIAGGLYLARGSGTVALPIVPGTDTVLQTGAACGSAVAGPCDASPIHVGIATLPARGQGHRSRPAPSPSASSRPATPRPSATGSASAQPSASASSPGTAVGQVLALINQARASAGLPPLTITAGLDRSASAHNARMADGCGLSHQCPGEPDLGARETAAGVTWTAAGENIGEGGPVASTTSAIAHMAVTLTQDMLNEKPPDDGHRKNILSSSFAHIGIAVYRDSSGTVWLTQDFSS